MRLTEKAFTNSGEISTRRAHFQIVGDDDVIHWPELDEDIELLRLFAGGESVESESSVQEWLAARNSQALAAQEPAGEYATGRE